MRILRTLASGIGKGEEINVMPSSMIPRVAITNMPKKLESESGSGSNQAYNSHNLIHYTQSRKHDPGMASNEFSTEMRTPEVIVIILILCLWVLSLRKLVKHFDKLRSTHYREIPYKYQLKDPENIANIKIVNNQNESVIYSRDPIKSLRSKSIACGDSFATANGANSINLFGKKPGDGKKKSVVESMLFGTTTSDKIVKTGPTTTTSVASSINYKKNLSTSLNSMSNYGAQRQCRNHSIGQLIRANVPSNVCLGSRASCVGYTTGDAKTKLDPAYLLPTVVRRSLLDLHRKSVENLATAASAYVPKAANMNLNITKNKESPSRDAAPSAINAGRGSIKSNRKYNINILRPPRLNLQRKSSNVTSDSTFSVKVDESPV